MKRKYFCLLGVTWLLLVSVTNIYSKDLFYDWSINVGFNTFRLIGDNISSKSFLEAGGGFSYIEPGIDISAICFLDSNYKHRIIGGGEYVFMNVKNIMPIVDSIRRTGAYDRYHKLQTANIYAGYHYNFFSAPFQDVRLYTGIELMANTVVFNDYIWEINSASKNEKMENNMGTSFRFGSRIRAGFEGRLKGNLYANISFTLGVYNLLGRGNDKGELFNTKDLFYPNESLQPFTNFLISIQYRFNQNKQ